MAIKLIKRHILLCDDEDAGYGLPPTGGIGGTDAVLIENFTHNPNEQTTLLERLGLTGALSQPAQAMAGRLAGMTFDAELKGADSLGDAPEISPLLRSCGLIETLNPGVDVTYSTGPVDSPIVSAAADMWDGGVDYHQFKGMRGSVGFTLEAGTFAKWNFTMTGHPETMAAQARPSSPTYDTNEPQPLKAITMDIGGYSSWEVYSATMNMNTTLSAPTAMTTQLPSGYGEVIITDYNPEIVVSFAAQDSADGYNPFDDMDNQVSRALTIGPVGPAGNRFTITAPQATITTMSTGDQEGRLTYEVTYQLAESALGVQDNFTVVLD